MDGKPKGLSVVAGRPIVERVADALEQVTDRLMLAIGDSDAAALPGVPRVRDVVSSAGPLSGIHAAMRETRTDVLVCAWDMPFANAPLLGALRRLGENGLDVVMPCGEDGLPEPLCAWYGASALPVIERSLNAGARGSIMEALHDCTVHIIPADLVRTFGDPRMMFHNVNTPDDLADARSASMEINDR